MNVLVIGGGGREHALAWKLAQSPRVARVFVAPGNGGTRARASSPTCRSPTSPRWSRSRSREGVALTVVGPEGAACRGHRRRLPRGGPAHLRAHARRGAARELQGLRQGLHAPPRHSHRARRETFTEPAAAHAYVAARGAPIVVKADGLAAGKGVVVATTLPRRRMRPSITMLVGQRDGRAGARVVIEDFLDGEEASFIVMVDGTHVLPLASSQDHKRLRDGDRGPNTGGMGAYSPAPVVTPAACTRAIMREIILPTVQGMAADGMPYSGFLYAGVMIDANGAPRVLEFNCRLGDPETQPILVRLRSDLVDLLEHGVAGTLDRVEAEWDRRAALGVVLAAGGYPDAPRDGRDDRRARPHHADDASGRAGVPRRHGARRRAPSWSAADACCA